MPVHEIQHTHRPSIRFTVIAISLFLIATSFVPVQRVQAVESFTMAFFASPDEEPLLKYAELVYVEAFHRLGMNFSYQVYPPKRCGVVVNSGRVDGEPGRVGLYNQKFPNLIRVEMPIIRLRVVAFAIDPSIRLEGWDSLQGTIYHVESILGSHASGMQLPKVVAPDRLSQVVTVKQALKKLQAGRTDIFVGTEGLVLPLLQTEEFIGSNIVPVGEMQDSLYYPFLHYSRADLVPKLAGVLAQMKEEGLLEKYYQEAVRPE